MFGNILTYDKRISARCLRDTARRLHLTPHCLLYGNPDPAINQKAHRQIRLSPALLAYDLLASLQSYYKRIRNGERGTRGDAEGSFY